MTEETQEQPAQTLATTVVRYSVQDSAIAELATQYLPLKIADVHDKVGLALVHEARMDIKRRRTGVEKMRVALKKDALDYGRRVDAEAARLTALLAPIEAHLDAEEGRIEQAKSALKAAEVEMERAKLRDRMEALNAVGSTRVVDPLAIQGMSDEEFSVALSEATAAHAQRQAALAAEAAQKAQEAAAAIEARKVEEQRLAAQREELARQQAAQAAAEKKLADDRAELERQRKALEAQATAERRAAEAEKDRVAAEERRKAETLVAEARAAEQKAQTELREKERDAKRELARPERERLHGFADVVGGLMVPEGAGRTAVTSILGKAANDIRRVAEGLGA